MLLACCFYAGFNCMVKLLGNSVSSYNVAFFRALFSLLTLLPFMIGIKFNLHKAASSFNKFNILRSVVSFASMFLFAQGLKGAPLNQAMAISSLTPIFTSLLAFALLKDKPSIEKWIAIFISLAGGIMIIKPDTESFNFALIYIVEASILWALTSVIMKTLTQSQGPLLMLFYLSLLSVIMATPYFIFNPYVPSGRELLLMIMMGALYNAAQVCTAIAYTLTKLSVVAPFDFARIILNAALGALFFNEVIEDNTIMGAILIILGTSLVIGNEYRVHANSKSNL